MKSFSTTLICAGFALAAAGAFAQDATKKNETMPKDGMSKDMTMQECRDHMAMVKKDGAAMKKDEAMMKQEAKCVDMMKKDSTAAEPMKK
jgi:hypothetical protein